MPNTSFLQRFLQVQLTLNKGEFADGSNSKIIDSLAMTASVEKLGPPDFGKASVEIYGMLLEDMEQLTTLNFQPLFVARNYINIFAGDDVNGMTQIFAGTITSASADFNSQPEIKFRIEAQVGFFGAVTAQAPTSIKGSQSVASFIEQQAQKMGLTFVNEGVTASIRNCVFNGSPLAQARAAANAVGAELLTDDDEMILLEKDKARKGDVPLLSKDTGLLGYPSITQNGIELKAIFNPAFRFAGLIEVSSVVPKTTGQWRIIKLTHSLSSNMPGNGAWESNITGFYPALSGATGRFV